jgi:hypothetical protein
MYTPVSSADVREGTTECTPANSYDVRWGPHGCTLLLKYPLDNTCTYKTPFETMSK